jgi:outer membrane protein TolC
MLASEVIVRVLITRLSNHFSTPIAGRTQPWLAAALVCTGLLATLHVSGPVQAQASLSLVEALRLAEARSPQLASAEYAATAARERGIASSQLPDPVLRLGLDNVPVTGPDAYSLTTDFMTMRRIGVMQEFTDSEKRSLRRQRGNVEADREMALRDATRATLRQDVAQVWLDQYFAQRTADLWRALVLEVRLQSISLEAGLATGRANAAELRAAQAALVQGEDQVAASEQQARTAATILSRWLGADARRIAGPLPDMASVDYDPEETAELIGHPQLAVLRQDTLLAETDLKLATRSKMPDWSVEVAYQQRGPAYSNMVSIGVSIPLPLFPNERQDRAVTASQAQLARVETLFQDTLQQHQTELRAGFEEWRSLQLRARSLQQTLLPLASDRVQQTLASYAGGAASLAQVLEARRAAVDARMQVLLLERDAARAWAKVNFQIVESGNHAQASGDRP